MIGKNRFLMILTGYTLVKNCESLWFLTESVVFLTGNTVIVTFEAFDIEPEPACEYDFVALYDGTNTSAPLLLKACGSSVPDPVQTTGHNLLFQFHSDPFSTHTVSAHSRTVWMWPSSLKVFKKSGFWRILRRDISGLGKDGVSLLDVFRMHAVLMSI